MFDATREKAVHWTAMYVPSTHHNMQIYTPPPPLDAHPYFRTWLCLVPRPGRDPSVPPLLLHQTRSRGPLLLVPRALPPSRPILCPLSWPRRFRIAPKNLPAGGVNRVETGAIDENFHCILTRLGETKWLVEIICGLETCLVRRASSAPPTR